MTINRCEWCLKSQTYIDYHDTEWGIPMHSEKKHFEFFLLETFQAGLSWHTILLKREGFREAFANFEVEKVAQFSPEMVEALMQNPAIIRNRLKIQAAITNAQKFLELQKEFGSFDAYIWGFTSGVPIINAWKSLAEVPATTPLSDTISKDLKKRGFKFVGSTTIYAHLQAIGVVNDHLISCFKHPNFKKNSAL